jgi:hypothetical protein
MTIIPENQQNTIEVPPQTLADARVGIALTARFTYLVIGAKDSRSWKVAMALRNDFPDLQIIRIENRNDAKEWLTEKPDASAIFFSNCGKPRRHLTQAESEDRTTTRKIIKEVKEQGCP